MFALVITGLVVANWDAVSEVFTSRAAAADVAFIAACFAVGLALATGRGRRRTTLGSVAATRNMGPALAAVALSFDGDPAVQGPLVSVVLLSVILGLAAAVALSRRRAVEDVVPA